MMIVLVRTIIIYLLVLFVIRIMGKSELSAMEPFQLVVTFMIADLAVVPIESADTPLFYGIAALGALLFIQVLVSYLTLKSERLRGLICGKPSFLIRNGRIDQKELKALRISMQELKEQLRIQGYENLSDVENAIIETNGEMSVVARPEKRPPTREDLFLAPDGSRLRHLLLLDPSGSFDHIAAPAKEEKPLFSQRRNSR